MTVKQYINHGAIHLHNGIFHSIDLSIDFSFSISLLFTKYNEQWNERKEDFCIAASAYHISKKVENHVSSHNRIFRHK